MNKAVQPIIDKPTSNWGFQPDVTIAKQSKLNRRINACNCEIEAHLEESHITVKSIQNPMV